MASKRWKGKACAYCAKDGVSEVPDHVIARGFVLKKYRDGLPMVPACTDCNGKKGELETYAVAVLPFGSYLPDSQEYLVEFTERRMALNQTLRRELEQGTEQVWIRENGVLVPRMTMPIRFEIINALLEWIVRGLFMFEAGYPLPPRYTVRVTNFMPEFEERMAPVILDALGAGPSDMTKTFGGGAIKYRCQRSRFQRYWSMWRVELFGGLQVGGDPEAPEMAFGHFSAMTFLAPDLLPEEEDLPDADGAEASMAARQTQNEPETLRGFVPSFVPTRVTGENRATKFR